MQIQLNEEQKLLRDEVRRFAEEVVKPKAYKANAVTRRYQWVTSQGPVTTTCSRKLWFFGSWECTAALGSLDQT